MPKSSGPPWKGNPSRWIPRMKPCRWWQRRSNRTLGTSSSSKLAQELKGHALAEFVAHVLGTMGYRSRVSPKGPDQGIDIIAHKDELGFEPPIIKVQVKSSEGSVGDPVVSALYGKVAAGEFGLLVTLGTFTNQARNFAQSKSNLRLIDGEELVALILQHYEQFDSSYKGLLPLKRVYVPEPLPEPLEEETE